MTLKKIFTYNNRIYLIASLIIFFGLAFLLLTLNIGKAATYYWTQTAWSGGATANYPDHDNNQTGWTEYSTADANIATGTEITLSPTSSSISQTSDADFGGGAFSSTETSGSGDSAFVTLTSVGGAANELATTNVHNCVTVEGNFAYLCQGALGIQIVDISTPNSPTLRGSVDTSAATDIAINGNYMYLADYTGGVRTINISDPDAPVIDSSFSAWGYEKAVLVHDGYLYVAGSQSGCSGYCEEMRIYQYDLIDPANPSYVSAVPNAAYGSPGDMYVDANDFLYIPGFESGQSYNRFFVYDISNPLSITRTDTAAVAGTQGYQGVVVAGDYAYIASQGYGIHIFDVSIPTDIKNEGYYDDASFDSIKNISTDGTNLFVADNVNGLRILDISSPTSPTIETTINTTGNLLDVDHDNGYSYVVWSGDGQGFASIGTPSYSGSGNFTSEILNTNGNVAFDAVSWNATVPANTTLSVKARTSDDPGMSGATAWGTCDTLTSGVDASSNNCVADGEQYIQYYAELTTTENSSAPSLEDITINYNHYPTSQTLTSSAFDAGNSENVVGAVQWDETLPTNTEIKFQVRTAPDSTGVPGNWSDWLGPTGTGDYYSDPLGGETINSVNRTGSNDQWMQYKVWLETSDQSVTPTLSEVSLVYVVNAPPEFESAATASQQSNGAVVIDYSVRDIDGSTGSGNITPSFEYSPNNGSDWYDITTGLAAGDTDAKAIDESSFSDFQATWTAKDQIDGTYTTEMLIRVTVDDGEAANNTAASTTVALTVDVKDPALGTYPVIVDATTSPASITLDATDDSTLEMRYGLNTSISDGTWQSFNASGNIALQTDPDTIYAQYRDNFGNSTAIQSVISPETPSNMVIRDLSNPDAPSWLEFISWKAVSTPDVNFAFYRIYHSTDGTNYSLLDSENDRTRNYYLHSGLSENSTHYYKIFTEETNGSQSYYSSVVYDTLDGQGGTDSTPPSISNVSISNINTQSATVIWDTDELSDSTVGYSDTAADFSTEVGLATMFDDTSGLGQHSVSLTGLTPDTTYYVQVQSADPSGNSSADNNGGDGYTFTTVSGPAISNVTPSSISNTKATISWLTNINAPSTVYYSTNSDMSGATEMTVDEETTQHEISLTELTQGTRYYYYVKSDVAIDNNGGEYYNFLTTQDSTSPVITAVSASPITDTQAVINWTTNEEATSQVNYGNLSGNLTSSTTKDNSLNILHTITLNNLTPDTTYYYTVTSDDDAANSSTSSQFSFTTLEELSTETEVTQREETAREEGRTQAVDETAPALSDITISSITESQATISWTSDEDANSFVQFGITSTYSTIFGNWLYDTDHEITITGLESSTEYHYRIISADASGNIVTSEDATFTTTADTGTADTPTLEELNREIAGTLEALGENADLESLEGSLSTQQGIINRLSSLIPSPLISGEPRVDTTPTSAIITWTTDKNANSLIAYASESFYNPESPAYQHVVGDAQTFQRQHQITITNLSPDTTYHYQIRSKGEVSGYATSTDFTFTTDRRSFGIENYTVDLISNEKAIFRWVTTESSDSKVIYMPYRNNVRSVEEAREETDEVNTLIHQIELDNLESGITYYVELVSTDAAGNITNQIINTFTTNDEDTPPVISQIQTDSALSPGGQAKVQTIISWKTNEPATSQVYYQKGVGDIDIANAENTQLDPNYTKDHVVIITTFDSGSVYQFQAESSDSSGLLTLSQPITILTPQEEQTVFEVIFGAVEDAFGWLRVFNGN